MRAVSGEKTGFAYADQISKLALEQSAQAARTIVRDTGNGKVQTLGAVEHRALYTSIDPLQSMTREEKLDILRRVDKVARAADQRVQEVSASLSGVYELILVAATDGTWPPTFVRWFVFPSACWWKRMASVSAAAAAVAGVLVMTISSPPRRGDVRADAWAKKRCAWRWSTSGGRRPCGDAAGGARRRLAWRPAA